MLKLLLVGFLAVASALPQAQNDGDLESILHDIFGSPPKSGETATQSPPQASTLVPGVVAGNETKVCTTDLGQPGECVPYYLCNKDNDIIDDGTGVIDIRVKDGPCPNYLDRCCTSGDTRAPEDPITPAPVPAPEKKQGCGWRNPDGVGFRIQGDRDGEAKFAEFPWMVAILQIEAINPDQPGVILNVYVGGGSLIHPSVVLTVAHYVHEDKTLKVRVGEWDTQTNSEIYSHQDRDVTGKAIHKDFNKGNLFYDIALLFLATPVDMSPPNVGLACLPPAGERAQAGVHCFASGWGKDQFGKAGRYQVILKKVEVPVVERNQCQDALRKTRLGRHFMLHSSFMCAGGETGKDTCKGDGGSPLVCPIDTDKDRYYQNGLVAWGIGCGENGTPGVYVDAGNLRSWVDEEVSRKGYETESYTY